MVTSPSVEEASNVVEVSDLRRITNSDPVDSAILVPYDIVSPGHVNNANHTATVTSPLQKLPPEQDLLPDHPTHQQQSYLIPSSPGVVTAEDAYPSEADLAAAAISADIDPTLVTGHPINCHFENDLDEVRDVSGAGGGVSDCGGPGDDHGFQTNPFDSAYFSLSTPFDLISSEF